MKRGVFIKTLMTAFLGAVAYSELKSLDIMDNTKDETIKMPVLFLGHGSPMNAIEENEFIKGFRKIASEIEIPKAIIAISAHWETNGTMVTVMEKPRTIHDFRGFPKELYEIQYPAPGMPEMAKNLKNTIRSTNINLDEKWGLDHGTWSVIRPMYPNANIPVIQLSLDYNKTPQQHYELAKELFNLRNKGVLIIGSGNIVHNLGMIHWQKIKETFAYDWTTEANEKIKKLLLDRDHNSLVNYSKLGKSIELAVPTPEHFLPLLYIMALQDSKDSITFFNDKPVAGSLTMTSVKIG